MDRLCEKCRKEFEEKIHVNRLLELAVERNHLLCVGLYITAGANTANTATRADANTATRADANITAVADRSITAGVDVNNTVGADAISYHRPVQICCQNGYDKCLKLLIEAGAGVNQRYDRGTDGGD